MASRALALRRTGLVTSVGLDAPASCAAIRAKLTNPSETSSIDANGEWIMAHQVPIDPPSHGLGKLRKMAAMAICEALDGLPRSEWGQLPLILCVAEQDRPGRMEGLEDTLFESIQSELGVRFASTSAIVPYGGVSVAVALTQAFALVHDSKIPRVLVAAADSLLSWPTLSFYERQDRLLTSANPNGFMPGEAAGALLLEAPGERAGELLCTGVGFGREPAPINSEQPLRAEGLSQAYKAALAEAGRQLHEIDFRITDSAGEQYYFKEAALVLSRLLRVRKPEFDLWHPAECTGEIGAASGLLMLAVAKAACEKRYTKGPSILAHMSDDAGQRAALVLQYQEGA
jgi:3-oxoacyl-[acyl-carrier-protein] synthase I